jgi:hypothetical protein
MKMKIAPLIAVAALVAASSIQAQFTQVDISSQVTADIQQYTDLNST